MFMAFAADPPKGIRETPDRLTPHRQFWRQVANDKFPMPDGQEVVFWGFKENDPNADSDIRNLRFPSAPIRLVEKEILHCELKPSIGPHTIHWHGIEPTAMNDGVGKLTFEVEGNYTYQWYASEAGTYFYHCHHNTVLHFEMGMYGMLIIDPPKPEGGRADIPAAPYPVGGPGYTRRVNEVIPYDVEAIWVSDDVDSVWHKLSHDAGMGYPFGNDVGLNIWKPDYFVITGRPHPWCANLPTDPNPGVAAAIAPGQTLLIRLLCAAYTINEYTFELIEGTTGVNPEVIAVDGRTLGHGEYNQYSAPFSIPLGEPFYLTAARRYDLLFKPTAPGTYKMTVNFLDWVTRQQLGTSWTFIYVA